MKATTPATVALPSSLEVSMLPIAELHASALNPRKAMDAAQLAELAQSIAEIGVTNPVLVRPWPTRLKGEESRYEIVAGHRRVEAAKLAGLTMVPALVRDMSDAEAMDVALVDNLQRVDLSPMEEADAYRVLAKSLAWNHEEGLDALECAEAIARKAGKTAGYVRSRLKLLGLIQPAQDALRERLIGFDAALLIAKLEPEDQDKATARALNYATGHSAEKALEEVREQVADERAELAKNPEYCDPEDCYQPLAASRLKAWIEENLLLDLANAPWPLESASVLPEAGACTTCPKRSGTDAALFADLTVKQDICTDSACFAAKKKAFVQIQMAVAKASGKPVVKISDAFSEAPVKEGAELEKVTFKKGQWVASKEGACAGTYQGVTPEGELRWVCVLQSCKVHKHQVQKPAAAGRDWKAEEQEREAAEKTYVERERPIREAVVAAIRKDGKAKPEELLRFLLVEFASGIGGCDRIAALRGTKACGPYDRNLIMKGVAASKVADLTAWARDIIVGCSCAPCAYQYKNVAQDREQLWAAAKLYGVNADAIAKSFESAKMPSPKAPVKKPTSSPARKVKDKPVKAKAAKKAVRK